MTDKTVVLGVTGSIAAYKACELVRLITKEGWDVSVIMTEAGAKFVTPLTFFTLSRNPVAVDMFEQPEQWVPGHISYAERADVLVIALCTANVMAKLTYGIADDLLTNTALACRAPLLLAPAMNANMWEHPATQANVATLKERGVTLVDVGEGDLACGYEGKGRMADPAVIVGAIRKCIES